MPSAASRSTWKAARGRSTRGWAGPSPTSRRARWSPTSAAWGASRSRCATARRRRDRRRARQRRPAAGASVRAGAGLILCRLGFAGSRLARWRPAGLHRWRRERPAIGPLFVIGECRYSAGRRTSGAHRISDEPGDVQPAPDILRRRADRRHHAAGPKANRLLTIRDAALRDVDRRQRHAVHRPAEHVRDRPLRARTDDQWRPRLGPARRLVRWSPRSRRRTPGCNWSARRPGPSTRRRRSAPARTTGTVRRGKRVVHFTTEGYLRSSLTLLFSCHPARAGDRAGVRRHDGVRRLRTLPRSPTSHPTARPRFARRSRSTSATRLRANFDIVLGDAAVVGAVKCGSAIPCRDRRQRWSASSISISSAGARRSRSRRAVRDVVSRSSRWRPGGDGSPGRAARGQPAERAARVPPTRAAGGFVPLAAPGERVRVRWCAKRRGSPGASWPPSSAPAPTESPSLPSVRQLRGLPVAARRHRGAAPREADHRRARAGADRNRAGRRRGATVRLSRPREAGGRGGRGAADRSVSRAPIPRRRRRAHLPAVRRRRWMRCCPRCARSVAAARGEPRSICRPAPRVCTSTSASSMPSGAALARREFGSPAGCGRGRPVDRRQAVRGAARGRRRRARRLAAVGAGGRLCAGGARRQSRAGPARARGGRRRAGYGSGALRRLGQLHARADCAGGSRARLRQRGRSLRRWRAARARRPGRHGVRGSRHHRRRRRARPSAEGADAAHLAAATARAPPLVYVSCDPQTLSRDARRIAAAGFRLTRAWRST